ncbi:hypothetical protein PMAYCL1PPCAC_15527, partial [Pristionchus mayeri]
LVIRSEIVPDLSTSCYFASLTVFGSIGYYVTYRFNLRELEKMRMKAVMKEYSVSRVCQIRENIAVLKLFNTVALPLVLCTIPAFVFYFLYSLIPPGIGIDNFRFICAAMFDLWLTMSCVMVITRILLHERRIVKFILGKPIEQNQMTSQIHSLNISKAYFAMLDKEW